MYVKFLIKDIFLLICDKYKASCERHQLSYECKQLEASTDVFALLKLCCKTYKTFMQNDHTFNILSFNKPSFNISKLSDIFFGLFPKNMSTGNPIDYNALSFLFSRPDMLNFIPNLYHPITKFSNLPPISGFSLENHMHSGLHYLINIHPIHLKLVTGMIVLGLAGIFYILCIKLFETLV